MKFTSLKFDCLIHFLEDNGPISVDDIFNKIIPSWPSFVVQLIAFLIMVFIVIKFGYKPVKNYIVKRQEFMTNELKSAKEKEEEATLNLQTSKQELNKIRSEANSIIEKAKVDALKTKEEIIASANQEVAMKQKQLEEEIALEKKQAQEEIRNDIIDVALLASSKVLQRDINDDDHQKMVNEFIDGLGE